MSSYSELTEAERQSIEQSITAHILAKALATVEGFRFAPGAPMLVILAAARERLAQLENVENEAR